MQIAVLGAGHIGSTVGRLWHAAGHYVTFAARDAAGPQALAEELGERADAATVASAVAAAEIVLVAVPGPAVVDVLTAAGDLDGRVVINAANMMGQDGLSLRGLADAFPKARWVRAFNTLQAHVLGEENHRRPPWVLFLSGDEQAKPVVARLIQDAGFEPVDLGGVDDSKFQDPGSALWNNTLEATQAKALAARARSGDAAAIDPLTAPFEKLRDRIPEDPAFFFEHLCRAVFQAGISWRVVAATNAQELLAILRAHGSIRGYLRSFPDARAAAADLHRRFRFLGDTGVWRLLTSAAQDAGQ